MKFWGAHATRVLFGAARRNFRWRVILAVGESPTAAREVVCAPQKRESPVFNTQS
jgi:hypothetical protein